MQRAESERTLSEEEEEKEEEAVKS